MPVDFQTYFLSSSPPGFDLESYASEHFLKQNGFGFGLQSAKAAVIGRTIDDRQEQPSSILGNIEIRNSTSSENAERILSWNQSYNDFTAISDVEPSSTETSKSRATMGKKKVSFADDQGLELEKVRIMEDSSDVPPTLQPDLITRLYHGTSNSYVENVCYVINFTQPMSDYLGLRNKVESNKVSLETAVIKNSSVLGTVRVKNISYEKRVFIRLTNNSWKTYNDINCSYVSTNGIQNHFSYDTFKFEAVLPRVEKEVHKIYFAICYVAGNEQFWDNNNGENYEIGSLSDETGGSGLNGCETKVFSLTSENSWTDFSSWDGIGTSDPYW